MDVKEEVEIRRLSNGGKVVDVKSGNSGSIYIIDNGENTIPRYIAYKTIKAKYVLDEEKEKQFLDECKLWFKISNRYIVSPFYAKVVNDTLFICMPFCDLDLGTLMLRTPIEEISALVIICQIVYGLIQLRVHGIKHHQDFNPPNILLQDLSKKFKGIRTDHFLNYDVKISDFGIANLLLKVGPTLGGGGGKYPYKAPEQYKTKEYEDYDPDTFALGIIIYMILTGEHPNGMKNEKALNKNTSGTSFERWAFKSPTISYSDSAIKEVINGCLRENPSERPTLHSIFELFSSKLKKLDLSAHDELISRFKYYDKLDGFRQIENELFLLSRSAELPNTGKEITEQFYNLLQKLKGKAENCTDVINICESFKYFAQHSLKHKVKQEFIKTEIDYLIELLKKWHPHIKAIHKYERLEFEDLQVYSTPDIRDYEITANYISIICRLLDGIENLTFTEDYFKASGDNTLLSMYYYHRAQSTRNTNIFKTIEDLTNAKSFITDEPLFDYMKYLWIHHSLVIGKVQKNFSSTQRSNLITIANNALTEARLLSPLWKTLEIGFLSEEKYS